METVCSSKRCCLSPDPRGVKAQNNLEKYDDSLDKNVNSKNQTSFSVTLIEVSH
jgi:hypothetical protein